ncbi:hypothetical protein ACOMHN_035726 [Nucella lapillus]
MATSNDRSQYDVSQDLREAVNDSSWDEVITAVPNLVCSEALRQWAIREMVKKAPERIVEEVMELCLGDQVDFVFQHILRRELWGCVTVMLQSKMNGEQHRRAVKEALTLASEEDFDRYVLPQCTHEELEQVLTATVLHDLWRSVDKVLERGVSTTQHRWAVVHAVDHASHADFSDYILPHCRGDELVEHVLSRLVLRGHWQPLGQVLERYLSTERRRWAVEEVSQRADYHVFVHYVVPYCHDEELEHVLPHLLLYGLWQYVGKMLDRGVDTTKRSWAVEQAIDHASDDGFVDFILPQCQDEELETILSRLASRGLWRSVGKVLERGVSAVSHRWAVEQAIELASDEDFVPCILPQCRDEERKHVLFHLVSRGLWEPVGSVLERGVSSAQHRWAVEQAIEGASGDDLVHCILPQCRDEGRQHILSHLVSRGQWNTVGKVLERGVSSAQHRWVVEQASESAGDENFLHFILPHCQDDELHHVLSSVVSKGLWRSVGKVFERGSVGATQHGRVVEEAAKRADDNSFRQFILRHCSEDDIVTVLPLLLANRKWVSTRYILNRTVCDALYTWIVPNNEKSIHDTLFWKFMFNCHIDVSMALDLTKAVTEDISFYHFRHPVLQLGSTTSTKMQKMQQREMYMSLATALLRTLCCVMCSNDMEYTDATEQTKQCVSDIYTHITDCIRDNTYSLYFNISLKLKNTTKWTAVFTEIADNHKTDPLFLLHFLQGLNLHFTSRRGWNDDVFLLVIFAVFPLFPQLQSTALRFLLHDNRWGVIKHACLSHVWEHDRRQLFKAAVEQSEWDVVRQWADHTVDDDQRDWAMKEALKEKQWMAYLLLADHGLAMHEHMHAMYIVAKYGDWSTVLEMVERGGDITEVSNMLETWVTGNLRMKPKGDSTVFLKRCEKLMRLRFRFEQNSTRSPKKSLQRCMWGSVLFNILHRPTEEYFSQVLHKVIEEEEWHILMHLVRLGMNATERDWLFPQMVSQQQWDVCRKLLDIGVDVQLCLEALPELMDRNQWTLVARVMEMEVDDAMRCQVMQWAFQRRAGALFWHCLTNMKNEDQLSMETRVKLFHQAISRDIWQAVKPLVEEKDKAIIQCRDVAFLEAIEQHLWDVVDHCQVLGADINIEDENGETPLHREARKEEFKAVEEIVFRDGKSNLLDMEGVSVLNRLIRHQQWDTVKFVIKYGGNIHLPANRAEGFPKTHTPLQLLIGQNQADVIQFTVIWCPEQSKGVNDIGETALHAVCDSDRWDVMEDLLMRRVNPLAVTETGQTALVHAVLNTRCPHRMVAECCRLGFSSHQPPLTGDHASLLQGIMNCVRMMWYPNSVFLTHRRPFRYFNCYVMQHSAITSPLVCAVMRDLPAVILMLYESGCSSRTELVALATWLVKLTSLNTKEGRTFYHQVLQRIEYWRDPSTVLCGYFFEHYYSRLLRFIDKNTAFMIQLATTPRTLLSSCRLQILRHFHFRDKKRQKRLQRLPLMVPLKNYLEFSDFCHPDYGQHVALPLQSPRSDDSSDDTDDDDEYGPL